MTMIFTMIAAGVGVLLILAVMRNRMRGSQTEAPPKQNSDRSTLDA
jgi:hypothetical protein